MDNSLKDGAERKKMTKTYAILLILTVVSLVAILTELTMPELRLVDFPSARTWIIDVATKPLNR